MGSKETLGETQLTNMLKAICIFSYNPLGYEMVSVDNRCTGRKVYMGYQSLINCASRCLGESSMFTLGNCLVDGDCHCECEKDARSDGTCNEMNKIGLTLYAYSPPGMFTKYDLQEIIKNANATYKKKIVKPYQQKLYDFIYVCVRSKE